MSAYTDYTPAGPWTNGQRVKRNVDGTLFTYVASINALMVVNNVAGVAKDGGGYNVIDIANPVNAQDAATKSYVDTHSGSGGGPSPSTALPLMNGVAASGSASPYSREDHIHPVDTSRAPLASPTFTGTPAAPTATVGTSTTQLATTAFVSSSVAAPSNANPTMAGTAVPGVSALYSRGDHVHPTDTTRAPLASPTFTGTPAAPTATTGTNTTQLATTAFVAASVASPSNANPTMAGVAAPGASALYSRGDHVHPTDTSRAPVASPALTGSPTTPTVTPSTDSSTAIASTAFVQSAISGAIGGSSYATSTPSATAPATPKVGDFWWYSDTTNPGSGVLYMWYQDPTSSQWIAVTTAGISDAPSDGNSYVRNNALWSQTIDAGTF